MKRNFRHKPSHTIAFPAIGCFLTFFSSFILPFLIFAIDIDIFLKISALALYTSFFLACISVFLYRHNITGWLVPFFLLMLHIFRPHRFSYQYVYGATNVDLRGKWKMKNDTIYMVLDSISKVKNPGKLVGVLTDSGNLKMLKRFKKHLSVEAKVSAILLSIGFILFANISLVHAQINLDKYTLKGNVKILYSKNYSALKVGSNWEKKAPIDYSGMTKSYDKEGNYTTIESSGSIAYKIVPHYKDGKITKTFYWDLFFEKPEITQKIYYTYKSHKVDFEVFDQDSSLVGDGAFYFKDKLLVKYEDEDYLDHPPQKIYQEYTYFKDGLLASKIDYNFSGEKRSITTYTYLETDKTGNWTKRLSVTENYFDKSQKRQILTTREYEYYE